MIDVENRLDIEGELVLNYKTKYGHPLFYKFTKEIDQLHSEKNYVYAHGGDPLGNFKRVSQIMKLYPGMDWASPEMVAQIYSLKQLDARLWLKAKGHKDKFDGVKGRLLDQAVYNIIQMCIESEKQ